MGKNLEVIENGGDKVGDVKVFTYDEAVELSGHGRYNRLLLVACSIISNAVALDMFGFGVVVAAATCDLKLGMTEAGMLASAPFAGLLFAFPWGFYADTQGRRRALLVSTSVGFTLAALSSLSPNWQVMLALKLLGCSFSTAAFTLTMTYLGECTGCQRRSQYLLIMNSVNLASEAVSFVLAYLLLPLEFNLALPWLSITYRPWRLLTLLMAIPLGLGAVMMYFLHESPKFLANKGDCVKALEVLKSIYVVNGGKREDYPVKFLINEKTEDELSGSLWQSLVKQTVPIFRPPLLWRTAQLFYLMIICCSTNNVFVMWFPVMVNSFFTSLTEGSSGDVSFCQRVIGNIMLESNNNADILAADFNQQMPCNDTISSNTIYSGITYGVFFTILNLAVSRLASWRRVVLLMTFLVSAFSGILVDLLSWPIASMVAFTLLQGTSIGIGITASYFVDLYPTSYRGLVTSLSMMAARIASFAGVNIVGAVINSHCSLTFYSWSIFVLSGCAVSLFLPKDRRITK